MAKLRMVLEGTDILTVRLAIIAGINERIAFISNERQMSARNKWRQQMTQMMDLYATLCVYQNDPTGGAERVKDWQAQANTAADRARETFK